MYLWAQLSSEIVKKWWITSRKARFGAFHPLFFYLLSHFTQPRLAKIRIIQRSAVAPPND